MASIQDLLTPNTKDIAARIIAEHGDTVVFVTPMLRAREIKLAAAARLEGWKVILIYSGTTPFAVGSHFDLSIKVSGPREMHALAKSLQPRLCHVFSGAVDKTIELFCDDKPSAVIADMNDVFVPSLFNYCEERFEPTRFVLKNADGFCARDLQAKFAQRLDGYELPEHLIVFPEYSTLDGPAAEGAARKLDDDEVRVVSVGSFTLESQGMYDSAYLQMAEMLTNQKIHFHIYPHWSYRDTFKSTFKNSLRRDLAPFFELASNTPYMHVHKSASLEELALELPQYDFGIISGGSEKLGQRLELLTQNYMDSCYSGRIADYVDARLPILINEEVEYNAKLLRHYGIGYDLGGLSEPGFRKKLQEIKHDHLNSGRMSRAAEALSIRKNAPRLSKFYKKVSEHHTLGILRLSPWMRTLRKVPLFSKPVERFEAQLRQQNKTLRDLSKLNRSARDISAKQQLIVGKQEETKSRLIGKLNAIDNDASDLAAAVSQSEATEIDVAKLTTDLRNIAQQAAEASRYETECKIEVGSIRELTPQIRSQDYTPAKLITAKISSPIKADEVAGMLNWPEIIDEVEQRSSFAELLNMIHVFENRRSPFNQHSEAWQLLAAKNLDQLLKHGFENFKRTIAANYFNFFIQSGDPQLEAVEALLTQEEKDICMEQAKSQEPDPNFNLQDQLTYWYFVAALWQFLRKSDTQARLTEKISEPAIGGPLTMNIDGVDVTQDLANSLLEYRSMSEAVNFKKTNRVLEIGAGHGRNAHAIMELHPNVQYFVVDIPPTLYISQRYLSSVFRDRVVFPVTDFSDFEVVRDRIEAASIVFLMPHQLVKLPDNYVQHSLSISSFGEMTRSQVQRYFDEIDRVTSKTFYFKQWKKSINPFDNLDFTENEYPVNPKWNKQFSRTCAVQNEFFEALYRIEST